MRRINFNMSDECASLLKGVCALKKTTISSYVHQMIRKDFRRMVFEDAQIRQMFLAGDYPPGSNAALLKEEYLAMECKVN